jgi:hypothetical protein
MHTPTHWSGAVELPSMSLPGVEQSILAALLDGMVLHRIAASVGMGEDEVALRISALLRRLQAVSRDDLMQATRKLAGLEPVGRACSETGLDRERLGEGIGLERWRSINAYSIRTE